MSTPNISLPTVPGGATDVSVAFNQAMQIVDALLPLVIQDKDLSTPPSTTSGDVGKRWIVGASPSAAWAGQATKIALCTAAGVWQFITPPPFIQAWVIDEAVNYRFNGTAWV